MKGVGHENKVMCAKFQILSFIYLYIASYFYGLVIPAWVLKLSRGANARLCHRKPILNMSSSFLPVAASSCL